MKKRNYFVLSIAVLLIVFAVPRCADADCVTPPSGLVSWWGGDNNALDIMGANNGTLVNGAMYGQGKVGQAFSFDGNGAYATVPASSDWAFGTGDFAISFWAYSTTNDDRRPLINNRRNVDPGTINMWAVEIYNVANRVEFHSGADTILPATNLLISSSWNHIAVTRSAGTLSIYINGVFSGSASNSYDYSESNDLQIGRDILPAHINDLGGKSFQGLIDEVEIFKHALSAAEIASIYNAGSDGMCRPSVAPPSGLVSWWKGENNANDQLGVSNGTLMNGAIFAPGKVGQAFSFNGINQYVEVSNSALWNFGSNNFSLNFWVNFDGADSFFLGHDNGGYTNNKWIFYLSGGKLSFHINGPYSVEIGQFPYAFAPGQWYHLAVTRSGSTYTIFANGAPLGTASDNRAIPDATAPLTIGQSEGIHFVHGVMDEIGIFNRALTADEIATIYNAGSSGMTPIDITPDTFTFISQTGMPLSTSIVSNPITVTGTNYPAPIAISGGEYQIDGGLWMSSPGTVSNGNTVKVRQMSSAGHSMLTTATLTIGGVIGAFNVTTAASGDPNASGLISWWRAENNALDSIGNNNGILHGGTTFAPGIVGQTFSFDRVDDYLEIPHSDSLNFEAHQPMSINLWVKRTSTSDISTIFAKRGDCGSQVHYLLQWYGPENWFVFGSTGAPANGVLTTADKLPLNTWTFISITFDGAIVTMYINGSPVGSNTMHFDPNTVPLTLGAEPACGDFFGGLIDEVKIFNRALSASEVGTLSGQVPNAFSFTAQTGMPLSTPVESNAITVAGISNPTAIAITGGEYSVSKDNGGAWSAYSSTTPATVSLNDQVKVRQTSSSSYSTTTTATLTIGGVIGTFSVTTMPIPVYTLTVTKIGNGIVTAIPEGGSDTLIWTGNTGTASYNEGTHLSFTAAAGTGYTFYEWTGDYVSYENPLQITMDSNKAIIATFDDYTGTSCINPPFKIGALPHNYPTIKDAYDGLGNNELLMIRAVSFTESLLNLNQGKTVGLSGGYACDFTTNAGFTTIKGTLTISDGTVTLENLMVQ